MYVNHVTHLSIMWHTCQSHASIAIPFYYYFSSTWQVNRQTKKSDYLPLWVMFHDTEHLSAARLSDQSTQHSTKKPVTTMLTCPWKCTVLHCNHLGNTWKPLVLMTRHFDYCPSASEGDNQSVRSSAPVVSRCFPGGYNVKLYICQG